MQPSTQPESAYSVILSAARRAMSLRTAETKMPWTPMELLETQGVWHSKAHWYPSGNVNSGDVSQAASAVQFLAMRFAWKEMNRMPPTNAVRQSTAQLSFALMRVTECY